MPKKSQNTNSGTPTRSGPTDATTHKYDHLQDTYKPGSGGAGEGGDVAGVGDDVELAMIPHRWWSWLVVGGSFLVHVLLCGLLYSSGVLYLYLLDQFHQYDVTHTQLALCFSLQFATATFTGILATMIVYRFGVRWSVVSGGILTSAGLMLWSLSTTVYHVYLTLSLLAGFGMGLAITPSIMIIDWYFHIQRNLAMTMAVSGTSIGTTVVPLLLMQLRETFGNNSELAIMFGFVSLGVAGVGTFMKAVESKQLRAEAGVQSEFQQPPLKNYNFIMLTVSNCLWSFGISVTYTYLPCYAVDMGHTVHTAAVFVAIIGFSGFAGRCFFAIMDHHEKLDRASAFFCTFLLALILTTLFPQMFKYAACQYGYAILLGIHIGYYTVYVSGVAVDAIGLHVVVAGRGWITLALGLGLGSGPLISGIMMDFFNSYTLIFHMSGSCLCISSLLLIFIGADVDIGPLRMVLRLLVKKPEQQAKLPLIVEEKKLVDWVSTV